MRRYTWLVLMTLVLGVASAWAVQFTIAPDRMAVVEGKRTFILGLYEYPEQEANLREVAESGYNLVCSKPEAAALTALQNLGLWGWVNTGAAMDFSEDAEKRMAALEGMVNTLGKHPAFLVWEVPDEALWNCWYGAQQWREGQEPHELGVLINALTDAAQKEQLSKDLARSRELRRDGEVAASEKAADAIWAALGKAPTIPNYGWSNAPERAAKMCEGMKKGYAKLRALDPSHPVWMNHAPRNTISQLAAFNKAADIAGCDIYPVPFSAKVGHSDLAERSMASVGAYTDRMQQAAPGKPVWMVLQGFGWGDIQPTSSEADKKELRRPTFEESRFMAYDSIVRGARGILYWGTASIEKDSTLWIDLLKLGKELHDLQPVLSAEDAKIPVSIQTEETSGSGDRGIRVLPKSVDGKVCFVVVNESIEPLIFTLNGLNSLNGVRYQEVSTGRKATVEKGSLRMPIRAQWAYVIRPE